MDESGERRKDVYRRVVAAVSDGNPGALDALLAADLVDHNPIPGQPSGRAGFVAWMADARAAFPDLDGTVEAVVGEGDLLAGRVTWRGTHRGTFVGVRPTGRPVEIPAFHLVRFEGNRIAEWWGTADLLGVLMGLGAQVVPPADPAPPLP